MRGNFFLCKFLIVLFLFPRTSHGIESWDIASKVLNLSSRKHRFWLYRNLPGVFPLTTLCTKDGDADQRATVIFPGDKVTFGDQSGLIRCGNSLVVWLGPNSSLKISEFGALLSFDSIEGEAFFKVGKSAFILKTQGVSFHLEGERDINFFHWKKTVSNEVLTCRAGEMSSTAKVDDIKKASNLVLSVFCKWNFRLEDPNLDSVMWHAESFHILDTFVNKYYRNLGLQNKGALPDIPRAIAEAFKPSRSYWLNPTLTNGNQIIMENSYVPAQSNCELWASDSISFSEAKILKKFLMPTGKFQVVLDAPIKPETNLAVFCENNGQYFVSNQYIPSEAEGTKQ